ncbi:phospholipase D-like domain-containing protein [Flavobacterium sp. UBA6195]|uniref:phospholipase D-like domain-containing protein n=1 Tax=Flavobacterium sp. UBA6195 TaxID=1946554 RepID=UPI0025B8BAE4|nr:phospholipase D-like domain-containing protein [Flavobacterium sp. UBA6195]
MQTEAVFENIANRIIEEIENANHSIYIAVAWFTNKNIFDKLFEKANKNCKIQLIISNDEINNSSKINFELLKKNKCKVYKIGNGDTELMHNKFCVIDFNTVITGSYNWSYKAESNFENIVINSNNTSLANQFVSEFNQIVKKYYPNENKSEDFFPLDKIIKRLEIIKNLIILEDIEEINETTKKLKPFEFNEDINLLIQYLNQHAFSDAISIIQNFINNYQQITIWNDPEVASLKLEIKLLENQINAFDNEKIEIENILKDFQYLHTIELGEVILEVLRLRKIKYKNHKKEAEAEDDFNNYSKQYDTEKEKKRFDLNNEEKKELKKNFRKATTLCHPDKVSEEQKAEAEQIFIELKKAYDEHDIEKVNQLLYDLENGKKFVSQSDSISEKENLKITLTKLKQKLKNIENEIIILKESDIYATINNIANWDTYFSETKTQLEKELQNLKIELNN